MQAAWHGWRIVTGYRLAIVLSVALWALAAFILPPLLAWALAHPTFTVTIAACGVALAFFWFRYRHELE